MYRPKISYICHDLEYSDMQMKGKRFVPAFLLFVYTVAAAISATTAFGCRCNDSQCECASGHCCCQHHNQHEKSHASSTTVLQAECCCQSACISKNDSRTDQTVQSVQPIMPPVGTPAEDSGSMQHPQFRCEHMVCGYIPPVSCLHTSSTSLRAPPVFV